MADPKLFLRGRTWWAWILGERRSTGCKDKEAARLRARDLERRAADPNYKAAHETTVADAIEAFLQDRKIKGRAGGTLHCYEVKTGHLARLLGEGTTLARINAEVVDKYLLDRQLEGASANTLGKELTALRGMLKIMRRRGRYHQEVAAVLPERWETGYQPRETSLSLPQARALIAHLARAERTDGKESTTHRAAWAAFALATGARRGEIERARREDIDLRAGTVLIRGSKTEKSWRTIPVMPFAQEFLAAALTWGAGAGRRLVKPWANVVRDLEVACEALSLPRVTPNDLRRTLSTWLHASGVEASLIAEVLGHTDSRMVEKVYGRLSPQQLGAAIGARVAMSAPGVLNLYGRTTRQVDLGDTVDSTGGRKSLENPVPRDGIEPPTRGFSVPKIEPKKRRKAGLSLLRVC